MSSPPNASRRPTSAGDDAPPTPPVRDASSLKGVKYGPGHEKFPSWPMAAASEVPAAPRVPPTGGSQRSKSWTDHTTYTKEKVVSYTRPYMRRSQSNHAQQQLKTVMERCEKLPSDTFESQIEAKMNEEHRYIPRPERECKANDYMISSPPERDVRPKDMEEYSRSFQDMSALQKEVELQFTKNYPDAKEQSPPQLTQAELEEYMRTYEEALSVQHQKQSSYAQSEGYHSYVSSTDSMSTPFLDRLRRDIDATTDRVCGTNNNTSGSHSGAMGPCSWENNSSSRGDRDSVVTTSSGSASSSETLKWHGSLSDVSVASSSFSSTSKQLIVHSAKVKIPQRHNSESVLYISSGQEHEQQRFTNTKQHLKLFPVSTYTVPQTTDDSQLNITIQSSSARFTTSNSPPRPPLSVSERVKELERQTARRYVYLDPKKKIKVPDPTLKAIQKKALLSFYERHQQHGNKTNWRSEPHLTADAPQPPPRPKPQLHSRRASSASEFASFRDTMLYNKENGPDEAAAATSPKKSPMTDKDFSVSSDLKGPIIFGPSISLDDWVPERPPKNSQLLRYAYPDLYIEENRLPSPDLPPPSPPAVLEDEVFNNDEPFPPPPVDISEDWNYPNDPPERLVNSSRADASYAQPLNAVVPSHARQLSGPVALKEISTNVSRPTDLSSKAPSQTSTKQNMLKREYPSNSRSHEGTSRRNSFANAHGTLQDSPMKNVDIRASIRQYRKNLSLAQKPAISAQKILCRSIIVDESAIGPKTPINQFLRSSSMKQNEGSDNSSDGLCLGFPLSRQGKIERSSLRYPMTQKMSLNGKVAVATSEKVNGVSGQYRAEPLHPMKLSTQEQRKRDFLNGANNWSHSSIQHRHSGPGRSYPPIDNFEESSNQARKSSNSDAPQPKISPPPPLQPRSSTDATKAEKPSDHEHTRRQELASYTPARAGRESLEAAVGSYKPIMQKEEVQSRPQRASLPDVLPDRVWNGRMVEPSTPPSTHSSPRFSPPHTAVSLSFALDYKIQQSPTTPHELEPKPLLQPPEPEKVCKVEPVEEIEIPKETTKPPAAIEPSEPAEEPAAPSPEDLPSEPSAEDQTFESPAKRATVAPRRRLAEELQCDRTRMDFLSRLPSDHLLHAALTLPMDFKSASDYIKGLFHIDSIDNGVDESTDEIVVAIKMVKISENGDFIKDNKNIEQPRSMPNAPWDMKSEKIRLCHSIERLVDSLRSQESALRAASDENETTITRLMPRLSSAASTKVKVHTGEIGQVTSLLAVLASRLARTHNAITSANEDSLKNTLIMKKEALLDQIEEAKHLKKNIDSRADTLTSLLSTELTVEELNQYKHYIGTKIKLLLDIRDLQDTVEIERQRLVALSESSGKR